MTEDAAHTQHILTHVSRRQQKFQHVHLAVTCSSLYRSGESTNAICSIIMNARCSIITLVKYTKDAKAEVYMIGFLVKMTIQANSSTNLKESVSLKLKK